jgi:hypothetical protein
MPAVIVVALNTFEACLLALQNSLFLGEEIEPAMMLSDLT